MNPHPTPLIQLPLPLDRCAIPPPHPLPTTPRVRPHAVWKTLSPPAQAQVRLIWRRVLQEVVDEQQ